MAMDWSEKKGLDHRGAPLPDSVAPVTRKADGEIVGYRVRWYETDPNGIRRHPSKSFSAKKFGNLDRALAAAVEYLDGARVAVKVDGSVAKPDGSGELTPNDVLTQWIEIHGPDVSEDYGDRVVRNWANNIETRPIGQTRLKRISADPSLIVHFQDELIKAGFTAQKRYEVLKDFRTVMRWGRKRHPAALTVDVNGVIELPKVGKSRLAYAADAVAVERLIEAVLARSARDDLLPLRDAAYIACMGFTIASRPSEWRQSVTLEDLHAPSEDGGFGTVELQRSRQASPEDHTGLKTGARAALVLPNAWDRITVYLDALEDRFGPQPPNALLFPVIGPDGPVWITPDDGGDPAPVAWTKNNYNQWCKRVWKPAQHAAAQAPDAPAGMGGMVFYDLRHTAISMALHSTLVVGPHGMNLHPLGGWAGHDIETLQRYYRHLIARYVGKPPIDIQAECQEAREAVEARPFTAPDQIAPQQEEHRRRRAKKAAARRREDYQVNRPARDRGDHQGEKAPRRKRKARRRVAVAG